MIDRRERRVKSCIVIENRARAVNVSWCAEFLGYVRQIDIFTVKFALPVMEKMHMPIYRQGAAISKSQTVAPSG